MSTSATFVSQAQKSPGALGKLVQFIVDGVPGWLRYLYFLRFSILLWVFPLVLLWANNPQRGRSLVSGIVTPATLLQYLCVAFFLIGGSFVALMLARVVVINGEERFGDKPPELLAALLAHKDARHEWIAPAASQLNNAIVFLYFFSNGVGSEGVKWQDIATGVGWGIVLAFLFWYAMSAIYYVTYRPGDLTESAMTFSKASARTLLFPRVMLGLTRDGKPCFGDALEDAEMPLPVDWIARLFPVPGYRWKPRGGLFEGHYFSLLSAFGFFGLYWTLWPLTAPIPVKFWPQVALFIEVAAGLVVYGLVLFSRIQNPSTPTQRKAARNLRVWKVLLTVPILGFTAAVPIVYYAGDGARFPILALVLILVVSLSWFFGAVAFFADRFRVPVLTVFVLVLLVPRVFHWTGAQEEHHLSIALRTEATTLPTSAAILDNRIRAAREPSQNRGIHSVPTFVIVTSTGGGIHAAAWTAAVLENLEAAFGDHFHDHLLLLSTVSGGSAGLYTYLKELHGIDPEHSVAPDWSQMLVEAKCSSLEAVGWGLVYYDIPKATVPLLPYLVNPSSGIDDLKDNPMGEDRTWALRRAFARNLNDSFCKSALNPQLMIPLSQVALDQSQNPDNDLQLTLAAFNAIGEHPFPAFSMNTTTVEDGARFLLANYRVERSNLQLVPPPAESFLDVYGKVLLPGQTKYPDLPLATAAQLSATFPYVSSAATFPAVPGKQTVHFVDGGYYDNDGTASAIEFIRSALQDSNELNAAPPNPEARSSSKATGRPATSQVRILLVEIRNSLDPNSPDNPPAVPFPAALKSDPKGECKAWNLMDQLSAPLQAFYGAGHGSVTQRNRNVLRLLEDAYRDKLILQHFVIDDRANGADTVSCAPQKTPPTDPLNWSLTPKQQDEIATSAAKYQDKYAQIFSCFSYGQQCPRANEEALKSTGR